MAPWRKINPHLITEQKLRDAEWGMNVKLRGFKQARQLGGGFKKNISFPPLFGDDFSNLTSIFFKWVGGSTTNQ